MKNGRKSRLDRYLWFFTTDDLRGCWRELPGGGDDAETTLRDDVKISRAELEAEIQRRVWWERFGNCVLMTVSLIAAAAAVIGAVAAVIAAAEGWNSWT